MEAAASAECHTTKYREAPSDEPLCPRHFLGSWGELAPEWPPELLTLPEAYGQRPSVP